MLKEWKISKSERKKFLLSILKLNFYFFLKKRVQKENGKKLICLE
jgi:hypothetical protein